MAKRQFGVSTHLYHGERLSRDHLLEIAAHGFETVELFATRTHFDYHNPAAVADLQQWLADAGLTLHGVHAPVMDAYEQGRWIRPLSLASSDAAARARAVSETELATHIARRIPVNVLVTHVGLPRTHTADLPADVRGAALRSIEEIQRVAAPLGVRIAVEVIPNELSRAGSLVHLVENDLEELEGYEIGICLDFGHAHMDGDLLDAIEIVSEHVIAAHVHDNRGRTDDHLVPFDGTIDWPSALTAVQKVGYDGVLLFEIASHGSTKATLAKAKKARERMERMLAH
ncbi:MAG TPA: sugar phosphate isomerase/epimerase [Vicinamibacterales bacterium]|nr:sugar phosphate isomerase/epimerase [Vicinamibacterales bacterium]